AAHTYSFDEQLPEDAKIVKVDFLLQPEDPKIPPARTDQRVYEHFGKPVEVPEGPLNTLTKLGVDIKTSKNLLRRLIQEGRNITDPKVLFRLALTFVPSRRPPEETASVNLQADPVAPQDWRTDYQFQKLRTIAAGDVSSNHFPSLNV